MKRQTMNDLDERLETALEGLVGDTEPIRELVTELAAELREVKAELAGVDASIEGQMAARISEHLEQLHALYEQALADSDLGTTLRCLNAKAAILGLSHHDRLEMKTEGFELLDDDAPAPPDSDESH
jgi:hypothetical protein